MFEEKETGFIRYLASIAVLVILMVVIVHLFVTFAFPILAAM